MISGIIPENQVQISLFDTRKRELDEKAMKALDNLNRRMGRDTVRVAVQGFGATGSYGRNENQGAILPVGRSCLR